MRVVRGPLGGLDSVLTALLVVLGSIAVAGCSASRGASGDGGLTGSGGSPGCAGDSGAGAGTDGGVGANGGGGVGGQAGQGSGGTIAGSGGMPVTGVIRYVSTSTGDDANPGTEASPWATLAKVNGTTFPVNSLVSLKRGDTWHEALVASSNGVTYDAYGSGSDPIIDGDDVRENLLFNNFKDDVVFRHIEVRNSQTSPDGGYGVLIQGGNNCLVEDVTIRNASKHACGAIETKGFTGRRVRAFVLTPGLGNGAATSFVSYGEGGGQDHVWDNCESTTGSPEYPSFIVHGSGPRNILLRNLVEHTPGSGIAIFSVSQTRVVIDHGDVGGLLINDGEQVQLDGTKIRGMALLGGRNHTLRNCEVTYLETDWRAGRPGVVQLLGTGTIVEDCVLRTGLGAVSGGVVAVGPLGAGTVRRNQLIGSVVFRVQYDAPIVNLISDNNVWCSIGVAQQGSSVVTGYEFAQWQALGFDAHSTQATCPESACRP